MNTQRIICTFSSKNHCTIFAAMIEEMLDEIIARFKRFLYYWKGIFCNLSKVIWRNLPLRNSWWNPGRNHRASMKVFPKSWGIPQEIFYEMSNSIIARIFWKKICIYFWTIFEETIEANSISVSYVILLEYLKKFLKIGLEIHLIASIGGLSRAEKTVSR